jgi:hypothetical protein
VEVYWSGNGIDCVLRSTDDGWEVALVNREGHVIDRHKVKNARNARTLAGRLRRERASTSKPRQG